MPANWGTGSRSSPIALDDSEEEVIQELTPNQFYRESLPSPMNHAPQVEEAISQSRATPDSVFTAIPERKRKRQEDDTPQASGPSTLPATPQTKNLENRLSQSEAKRSKKRRKKQQRQAAEQHRSQSLNWLNNPHLLPGGIEYPHPDEPLLHAHMNHEHIFGYDDAEGSQEDLCLDYGYSDDFGDEAPYASSFGSVPLPPPPSSSWVSSMAMAAVSETDMDADEEVQMRSPFLNHVPTPPARFSPSPPPPPLPPPPILPARPTLPPILPLTLRADDLLMSSSLRRHILPPSFPPPIPPPPFSATTPSLSNTQKSQPKPLSAQIGQAPDTDPKSKHGTFQFDPSVPQPNIKASPKLPIAYSPNPARTLVMEQLPKVHRDLSFVGKWARNACGGVAPKFILVDTQSSKALVEFPSADAARKAFASPRLGQELKMIKQTSLLKGKPRTDQIKVWWYRVAGIGAGAGVGEIEEGEIEDDQDGPNSALEKEQQQQVVEEAEVGEIEQLPPQKETKKQRKARLAKVREEKRMQNMPGRMHSTQSSQINPIRHPLPAPPLAPTALASSSPSLPPLLPLQDLHLPPLAHDLPAPLPSFLPSTIPYPFDMSYPLRPPSTFGPQDWPSSKPILPPQSQPIFKGPQGYAAPLSAPSSATPAPSYHLPNSRLGLGGGNNNLSTNQGIVALPSMSTVHSPPAAFGVISAPAKNLDDGLADYEDVQAELEKPVVHDRREVDFLSKDLRSPLKDKARVVKTSFPPLHHSLPPRPLPMRPRSPPAGIQVTVKAKKKAKQVRPTETTKIQKNQSSISASGDPPSPLMADTVPLPSQADAFKAASTQIEVPLSSAPSPSLPSPSLPNAQSPDTPASIIRSTIPEMPQGLPSLPVDLSGSDVLGKQALLLKERILHEKITRDRLDPAAPSFKFTGPNSNVSPAALTEVQEAKPDTNNDRPSTPSSQAMEDSLRMMVLATKKAKAKPTPPTQEGALEETKEPARLSNTTVIGLPTPPPTAPLGMSTESLLPSIFTSTRASSIDRVVSPSPPPFRTMGTPLPQLSVAELSLEELAISFITQTIETVKNSPHLLSSSNIDSNTTPSLPTPPPAPPYTSSIVAHSIAHAGPSALPILSSANASIAPQTVLNTSVASQLKAELALKQKRIENHVQDSKSLMERISKSKSKAEKDLLMKILREKTRLFEEENKASERKISKISASSDKSTSTKSTTSMISKTQLQRWPTSQQDGVLILSDSEDDDDMDQ